MMFNEQEFFDHMNDLNAPRAAARCRQEALSRMAIQWGGWALAALILVLELIGK